MANETFAEQSETILAYSEPGSNFEGQYTPPIEGSIVKSEGIVVPNFTAPFLETVMTSPEILGAQQAMTFVYVRSPNGTLTCRSDLEEFKAGSNGGINYVIKNGKLQRDPSSAAYSLPEGHLRLQARELVERMYDVTAENYPEMKLLLQTHVVGCVTEVFYRPGNQTERLMDDVYNRFPHADSIDSFSAQNQVAQLFWSSENGTVWYEGNYPWRGTFHRSYAKDVLEGTLKQRKAAPGELLMTRSMQTFMHRRGWRPNDDKNLIGPRIFMRSFIGEYIHEQRV
jgi:hypothetical protein